MSKPHFHKDLARGKAGELAVQKLWPELIPTDGRSGDFVLPNGDKVEVKSDSYNHDVTPNFFIELVSNVEKGKSGGPAQAAEHGCKYYCYYYSSHNIAYIFEVADLIKQVEDYVRMFNPKPVEVRNIRWTTIGLKVSRRALKPLRILGGKP